MNLVIPGMLFSWESNREVMDSCKIRNVTLYATCWDEIDNLNIHYKFLFTGANLKPRSILLLECGSQSCTSSDRRFQLALLWPWLQLLQLIPVIQYMSLCYSVILAQSWKVQTRITFLMYKTAWRKIWICLTAFLGYLMKFWKREYWQLENSSTARQSSNVPWYILLWKFTWWKNLSALTKGDMGGLWTPQKN